MFFTWWACRLALGSIAGLEFRELPEAGNADDLFLWLCLQSNTDEIRRKFSVVLDSKGLRFCGAHWFLICLLVCDDLIDAFIHSYVLYWLHARWSDSRRFRLMFVVSLVIGVVESIQLGAINSLCLLIN